MKYISVKEFREHGYLQELNRQFLHPLGLALSVEIDDDGNESLGGIWDCREDETGLIFDEDVLDTGKTDAVVTEQKTRHELRKQELGYDIQPVEMEQE